MIIIKRFYNLDVPYHYGIIGIGFDNVSNSENSNKCGSILDRTKCCNAKLRIIMVTWFTNKHTMHIVVVLRT